VDIELWVTFIITAGILIAIPGPTNLMVMAYGLRYGTKSALGTVFGVVFGVIVAMILSFVGLGAILAVSSESFILMKWAGAIYLIYLGVRQWQSTSQLGSLDTDKLYISGGAITAQALTVSFLNPKGINPILKDKIIIGHEYNTRIWVFFL